MDHFYKNIPGFFGFGDIYQKMVQVAPSAAHFVEVGAFLGTSSAFMAVEIVNSKKKIQFDVVDYFQDNEFIKDRLKQKRITGPQLQNFKRFTEPVKDVINLVILSSFEASQRYKDKSLDFVFIDADHNYWSVLSDIKAWRPKIKTGGYIGGHDYCSAWPGVIKAVDEVFKKEERTISHISWLVKIK